MKMTKKLYIVVAALLSLGLTSTSVWAGSKQQHRWEGVAIGVGAAIIGGALINHHTYGFHSGPPVAFSFNYRETHRQPSRHHRYTKPHRGGHNNHWRSCNRWHRYKGYRHHGKWLSSDRGHHGQSRSHNSGRGGPRH